MKLRRSSTKFCVALVAQIGAAPCHPPRASPWRWTLVVSARCYGNGHVEVHRPDQQLASGTWARRAVAKRYGADQAPRSCEVVTSCTWGRQRAGGSAGGAGGGAVEGAGGTWTAKLVDGGSGKPVMASSGMESDIEQLSDLEETAPHSNSPIDEPS